MFLLYDLIFLIFALVYLPVFLLKKKMHAGFSQRLGKLPAQATFNRPVWIHAVSVGEAMSVKHLVETMRKDGVSQFVISTVTATGNKIARNIAAASDQVIFLPLDFSAIVKKVVDRIDPAFVVIAETEFWPNLLRYLAVRNIPVAVVNGRISDRSFGKYRLIRWLLKPLLNRVSLYCVQTQTDCRRLLALGVSPEKVRVTGNMKFDISIRDYDELRKDYTDYRIKMQLRPSERLWVCASTHEGEEDLILDAYETLRQEFPFLKLLIAPRHPERAAAIEALIVRKNCAASRISKFNARDIRPQEKQPVFLLDTIGQLLYFYAIADIVFVGGSLVPRGGHNILEPGSLGKPIIVGPHLFNFRDITDLFLNNDAALAVQDGAELVQTMRALLREESRMAALGARARQIILENQGATARNAELLRCLAKERT